MISPEVIKKIKDKRREKTRSQDNHVPAHKDVPVPRPEPQAPRKQEDPGQTPGKIIEISVV